MSAIKVNYLSQGFIRNGSNNLSQFNVPVKNELATYSDAEIMAKLDAPEVQLANAMGRPNPGTELDITPDGFSIQIVPDLDIRKLEGILLVWQTDEGILESKFTTSNEGEGPSPLKVS